MAELGISEYASKFFIARSQVTDTGLPENPAESSTGSTSPVEVFTDERCFITEVSNSSDDPDVSIALARVEPGVTTAWHSLYGTTERYLIQSGEGLVEVGEQPAKAVMSGDVVHIAAGVRQRITNTGNTDLLFYAICSPRFLPENYIDLEGQ